MHNQQTAQNQNTLLFYLIMGYNPRAIPSITEQMTVPMVEQWLENLQKARNEAAAAHEIVQ